MATNWVALSGNPVFAVNMNHVASISADSYGIRLSFAGGEVALPPTYAETSVLNLSEPADIDAIKRWVAANVP